MLLPALFFVTTSVNYNGTNYSNLYTGSGTNSGYIPFIDSYYASFNSYNTGSFSNPNNHNFSNSFSTSPDPGAKSFFTQMFKTQFGESTTIGGAIAFADGINNATITGPNRT